MCIRDRDSKERRAAYDCDITYVTNNELGFYDRRDNMVMYKEQLVQRGLHFAIIDEVDSVLIDEARTPLIISGQSGKSTKLYEACDILARQLERGEASGEFSKMNAIMGEDIEETGDFIVNEKEKAINLTAVSYTHLDVYKRQLQSILNLPKGTENFLTDVHGEYEAFSHVLKNGSGSVRRKIEDVFGKRMSDRDKRSLATPVSYTHLAECHPCPRREDSARKAVSAAVLSG